LTLTVSFVNRYNMINKGGVKEIAYKIYKKCSLRILYQELFRLLPSLILFILGSLYYGFHESLGAICLLMFFISSFIIFSHVSTKLLFKKYKWDVGLRLNRLWKEPSPPSHKVALAIAMLIVRATIYIATILVSAMLTSFLLRGTALPSDAVPPSHIIKIIEQEKQRVWVGVNTCHILGQIKTESNFKEKAKRIEPSGVTSYGLMQVLDVTLNDMIKKSIIKDKITPEMMLVAKYSIIAGLTYDKFLWNLCNWTQGNERYAFMFSAYNGGYGWLKRDRKLTSEFGFDKNKWFGNVEYFSRRSWRAFKINREYPVKIFKYSEEYKEHGICN